MNREFINKKVGQLKQINIFEKDTFYKEALENIIDSNKKRAFKIAVVGEFSTGKSTFINAIIGVDLLSHATEEVTAAITNIYNVPKDDKRYRTCDVTFVNEKKLHLEDDTKLMQYTTTRSKENDVVREIKCVDYYANYMPDNTEVVIVDTPGLNGMADGHRELTLEEVKSADFCIYLFGIRGVADSDKVIIKQLEYYQNNFIFVLNFVDQLKISEGESVEERISEISDILKNEIFIDKKVDYMVFGISALKALAYKDKTIKKLYQGDTEEITSKDRECYYDQSRFEEFEEYIRQKVNSSTIEKLCIDRMAYLLCQLLDSVLDRLNETQEHIEYLKKEAKTSQGIKNLQQKIEYFSEISEKNKRKVLDYARNESLNVRKEFLSYVRDQLKLMVDEYQVNFRKFKKYEEFEGYIRSGSLDRDIKIRADQIYNYVEDNMVFCLNRILNNILVRIQEYLKDIYVRKDNEEIEFEIKKISPNNEAIISLEDGLKKTKQKIKKMQDTYDEAKKDYQKACCDYENSKNKLEKSAGILAAREQERERKIRALGVQPKVEKRTEYTTEYYTDYEERWGIFKIFGKKEVRRSQQVPHTFTDDSARKKWVKKRDEIQRAAQVEIDRCREEVDADRNRIKSSERKIKKKKEDAESVKNDLVYYENKLALDKALLDDLKEKANQEMLNTSRNSVLQQLREYCDFDSGTISLTIKNYIKETIEKNGDLIYRKTERYYDERVKQILDTYKREVDDKKQNNLLKYGDHKKDIEKIMKIRKELENEQQF